MPLPPSITPDRPFYTSDNNYIPLPHWKQPDNFNRHQSSHLPELPSLELVGEAAAALLTTTQPPPPTRPQQSTTIEYAENTSAHPILNKNNHISHRKTADTRVLNLSKTQKSMSTQKVVESSTHRVIEQIEVDEMPTPAELNSTEQPANSPIEITTIQTTPPDTNTTEDAIEVAQEIPEAGSFANSQTEIRVSKEGDQIKLEWDLPEKTICDNYLVNTTLLDSKKSLSTASANPYSYIKFYSGERISVFVD